MQRMPNANHRVMLTRHLALMVLVGLALAASLAGCLPLVDWPPEQQVDIPFLETQVAEQLSGTLTAQAPTITPVPTNTPVPPTPAPSPTPTRAPFVSGEGPFIVFVRKMQEETVNIVLNSGNTDLVLSRFIGDPSIVDLVWSHDGQWLLFTSAHNYMASRNNERNIYAMRPDGTGLRMLTGDYVDPARAEGPFVTLYGNVIGAVGECLVSAQGAASAVTTTINGAFELPGVPVSATWVRAVCMSNSSTMQGDASLSLKQNIVNNVDITVSNAGRGWTTVALSPDGCRIAGISYTWEADDQGERRQSTQGNMIDLQTGVITELKLPENTIISDLSWSPQGDRLVGALTGEDAVYLGQWNSQGEQLDNLLEIPFLEDTMFSISDIAWSYDGSRIAFSKESFYWWGETRYKTEIDVYDLASNLVSTLVTVDWGVHAQESAWSADSQRVYYQLGHGEPSQLPSNITDWQIWWIPTEGGEAVQFTQLGVNMLPAIKSDKLPRSASLPGCLEP